MKVQPRFTHDCVNPSCCRFVGQTVNCDVYMYPSALGETGLIMRRGDQAPDYSSWPALRYAELSAAHDVEVTQALELVKRS